MSENVLPMFYSRSFIVYGLTFRSLIHFEFIFVYGVRNCSSFILLQGVDQFTWLLLLLLSCFSRVWLCATPETAAHQAPHPWDSPGKNTGVGCHFLLQWMKVKSQSEVAQSCPTLSNPMDCSLPGLSVHGILQARVLEWGAIAFSGLWSMGS